MKLVVQPSSSLLWGEGGGGEKREISIKDKKRPVITFHCSSVDVHMKTEAEGRGCGARCELTYITGAPQHEVALKPED